MGRVRVREMKGGWRERILSTAHIFDGALLLDFCHQAKVKSNGGTRAG